MQVGHNRAESPLNLHFIRVTVGEDDALEPVCCNYRLGWRLSNVPWPLVSCTGVFPSAKKGTRGADLSLAGLGVLVPGLRGGDPQSN